MHEVKQYQLLHPTPVMQLSVDRAGTLVRGTIVVSVAEHGTAVDALAAQVACLRQHKTDYMEAAEQTRKALAADNQRLREALEEIVKQYPNPDISHVDYRVHACRHAEIALAGSKGGGHAEG